MTTRYLLLALLLPLSLWAQEPLKGYGSRIDHVLVFFDAAQITRQATIALRPGINEFYFDSLSVFVRESSIQLRNDKEISVLGIGYSVETVRDPKVSAELDKLTQEHKDLNLQIDYLKVQSQNLDTEIEVLKANQGIAGSQNGIAAPNLSATLDFWRTRLQEILDKQREIDRKVLALQAKVVELSQQSIQKKAKLERKWGRIKLRVKSPVATTVNFQLSYLVNNAGWTPEYDLRLKDIASPLQLTYKAVVAQQTGADWNHVRISLSNGTPTTSNLKPVLLPWRMDYNRPQFRGEEALVERPNSQSLLQVEGIVFDQTTGDPLPGATVLQENSQNGTVSDLDGRFRLTVPRGANLQVAFVGYATTTLAVYQSSLRIGLKSDEASLDEVVVVGYAQSKMRDSPPRSKQKSGARREAKMMVQETKEDQDVQQLQLEYSKPIDSKMVRNQTFLQYDIEQRYTVASGDNGFSVDIKQEQIAARYQYAVVPKLERDAFLMAQIPNWAEFNLLDGALNIYFEGTYMGSSMLKTDLQKDTMELSIGRDKGIFVSRDKLKDFSQRRLFGTKRQVDQGFEISLRNTKSQAVDIVVEDHYPIPAYEDIEVKQIDHSGAELDPKTQILRWRLHIEPGKTEKRSLKFSVKYPKNRPVYFE